MDCRESCGACCIAPSITAPIPGMPNGKPAGVRCIQLDDEYRCKLFGHPSRPQLCDDFKAEQSVCGDNREQAITIISDLELATSRD